jgi:hypothetical protein
VVAYPEGKKLIDKPEQMYMLMDKAYEHRSICAQKGLIEKNTQRKMGL